jgi:hypothetical protein
LTLGSTQRKAQMDSSVEHWNDRRREIQAGNAIALTKKPQDITCAKSTLVVLAQSFGADPIKSYYVVIPNCQDKGPLTTTVQTPVIVRKKNNTQ